MPSIKSFTSCCIVAATVCMLTACFPPRDHADLPTVSVSMSNWAQAQWHDATPVQLQHGRDTMLSKCTECHSMPSPSHESVGDWPGVMKSMAHKAKVDDDDQTAMLRYILSARQTATGKGG
jgi:hypothetical protein